MKITHEWSAEDIESGVRTRNGSVVYVIGYRVAKFGNARCVLIDCRDGAVLFDKGLTKKALAAVLTKNNHTPLGRKHSCDAHYVHFCESPVKS